MTKNVLRRWLSLSCAYIVLITPLIKSYLLPVHNSQFCSTELQLQIFDFNAEIFTSSMASDTSLGMLPNRFSPISLENPFGSIPNDVSEAIEEVKTLALKSRIGSPEPQIAFRIDYLVKYLESKYVPIHTKEFYSMTHNGNWSLLYSNSLSSNVDPKLECNFIQSISSSESHTEGLIINNIYWKYAQVPEDASGVLEVNCRYKVSASGAMAVSLIDHILRPEVFPYNEGLGMDKSCEMLLESIQTSIPFESFDPNDTLIGTSFMAPNFRIARVLGERYPNLINIFEATSDFV